MKSISFASVRKFLVPPSKEGWILGYFGLIPFIFLSILSCLAQESMQSGLVFALLAYGATILSFLGAIHWGLAILKSPIDSSRLLVWAVVPSLWAWVAVMAGSATGLWLITMGLWACYLVDMRIYPHYGLKDWLGMRLMLTVISSLSCIVAALFAHTVK